MGVCCDVEGWLSETELLEAPGRRFDSQPPRRVGIEDATPSPRRVVDPLPFAWEYGEVEETEESG